MSYDLLDSIGNTPLVEIRHLNPNPSVQILAKLEYLNPGGSIKDRAALFMINAAEKSGQLTPAKTVIEATSGNTGIGLALVCAVKGYRLLLTMSEAASIERRKILQARGAEILLTPGHLGTDGAIEEAYRLARENPDTYFMTDQFNNEANWQAHYHGTAPEIWEQTEGRITKLVATMGTTGTLMGLQRRLKEYNPDIEIVGVEPYLGHKIQGLKNMKEAYCPEIFDKDRLDKKVNIDDEDAYETARQLAGREGLFVGMSSGAAMFVALNESRSMTNGTIVVILPDGGERYLSTPLFTVKEKVGFKLYNTLGRTKEHFVPGVAGKVSIYSSGPTAHARMHPGECRRMVFADLLVRYLEFRGYAATHVMNVTDLDDKTIAGSESKGLDLKKFTDGHIESFKKDLATLRIKPATKYPRTSEHLADMVALADRLVAKGAAYEKLRSLYFNIGRYADYGKLSGIDIDKIKIGATVDLENYEKNNPRDFTLLKRSKLSELKKGIYTKTQWGNVRPSWHLQCAAIALKHLGERYDIHLSGRELMFPHHENEIAIAAVLTGNPPARFWVNCDRVLVEGKKINEAEPVLSLDDLTAMGFSGREIRWWLLTTHYAKSITFSEGRLADSRRALKRLDACVDSLRQAKGERPCPDIDQLVYDIKNDFVRAMDDDLNIAAAMAALFKTVRKINRLLLERQIDAADASKILAALRHLDTVLQVFDFDDAGPDPEVAALVQQREAARQDKNWALADRIREQLRSRGVDVKDARSDTV